MLNFKTSATTSRVKSGNEFLVLCKKLIRTFPSLPEELAASCNFTMTTLLQWVRPMKKSYFAVGKYTRTLISILSKYTKQPFLTKLLAKALSGEIKVKVSKVTVMKFPFHNRN